MLDHRQFALDILSGQGTVEQILALNQKSAEYGLTLTREQAVGLVHTREVCLRGLGRVEIGGATIGKLIDAFCDSAYLNQDEYAEHLNELLEAFYYMKNETLDKLPDDELIALMRRYYEERCSGSTELLLGRELELLARHIRYGVRDYANLSELDVYGEDDWELYEEEYN